MKMAKATQRDLDMAMELCAALPVDSQEPTREWQICGCLLSEPMISGAERPQLIAAEWPQLYAGSHLFGERERDVIRGLNRRGVPPRALDLANVWRRDAAFGSERIAAAIDANIIAPEWARWMALQFAVWACEALDLDQDPTSILLAHTAPEHLLTWSRRGPQAQRPGRLAVYSTSLDAPCNLSRTGIWCGKALNLGGSYPQMFMAAGTAALLEFGRAELSL